MRLVAGLAAAALSGVAAGSSSQPSSADVYIFPSSSAWQSSPGAETPRIPKEIARHILLQRTSRQRYGSDLRDIPSSIDTDAAVGHIARFGKGPTPLFTHSEKTDPAQLVVLLEGAAPEQSSRAREKLAQHAAFAISDPPSATANSNLMALFRNLGVSTSRQCDLPAAINPFDTDCWTGPSSVVKYDLRTSPTTLDSLFDSLARIDKFVTDGDLELTLVVLPESSRSSKLHHWSAAAAGAGSGSDLRRRDDSEMVISEHGDGTGASPTVKPAAASSSAPARRPKSIPQCFATLSACMAQTNSCSGHGECVNKYAVGGGNSSTAAGAGAAPAASCFVCACKASVVEGGDSSAARTQGRRTVHWGGNMCQKEDVSVQFWLFAGFTVAAVGAVSFAIGLLFGVGEEPLPGVIGAGVSRSK